MLGAYLFNMQVFRNDYYRSLSEKNRIRIYYLEGPRGRILDRNGKLMAGSRLSYNCSLIPREAKSRAHESLAVLAGLIGADTEELESRFKKRKPGAYNSVLIAEDIPAEKAMAVEEQLDLMPGFIIETRPQREYALGESAAHLLGYIGPLTKDEKEELEDYGYSGRDWIGRDGLEKYYESYLRGVSGGLQVEVDSRGRFMRTLGVKQPAEGKDIQLTVDADLQEFIQKRLEGKKGSVVIMRLDDGGLLAMNSSPSFDPNLFASTAGRRDVGKYFKDSDSPMMNRSIRGQYPPGSIFKIITSMTALGLQKINSNTTFLCPGFLSIGKRPFPCWKEDGHGPQNLTEALAHSCNVFFYKCGLAVGPDALTQRAMEWGYGAKTGIDEPGEKKGFVPSREWKKRTRREAWFDGETANFAIGQGYLQVTPMQALMMIASVAKDGRVPRPHLLDKVAGVKITEASAKNLNLKQANLEAVKRGLDQVVNSDTGTGRLARNKNVRIYGKTGTAESGQDIAHAWFVGYAPASDPSIAMVVFIENGGRGGVVAGGFAGEIFRWLDEHSYFAK